jgi:hypothetical protein
MEEITFQVNQCEESGWLVASWDAPDGEGGITTQARDLRELQEQVVEATQCHFEPADVPRQIRLHFVNNAEHHETGGITLNEFLQEL